MREFSPPFGLFIQDNVKNFAPQRTGWAVDSETRKLFVEMQLGDTKAIYEQLAISPSLECFIDWMSHYPLPHTSIYHTEPYDSLNFDNDSPEIPTVLTMMNRSGGFLKAQRTMNGFNWSPVQVKTSSRKQWGIDENGHHTDFTTLQHQKDMQEIWVQSPAWNALQNTYATRQEATDRKKEIYIPPIQEYTPPKDAQLTRVLQLIDTLNALIAAEHIPTCYMLLSDTKLSNTYYFRAELSPQLPEISENDLLLAELDEKMYEEKKLLIMSQITRLIPMFLSGIPQKDFQSKIDHLFKKTLNKIHITKFVLPSQSHNFFIDYSFD